MKKCPKCAEQAQDEAIVCPHCRHRFRSPAEERMKAKLDKASEIVIQIWAVTAGLAILFTIGVIILYG